MKKSVMKKSSVILSQMLCDAAIVAISYFATLFLRVGEIDPNAEYSYRMLKLLPIAIALYWIALAFAKLYVILVRYFGNLDILKIVLASFVSGVCFFAVTSFIGIYFMKEDGTAYLPVTALIVAPFFASVLFIVERIIVRMVLIRESKKKNKTDSNLTGNIMIIGAGAGASLLIQDMNNNQHLSDAKIVAIIDDDPAKQGMYIKGSRVCGTRDDIVRLAAKLEVKTIIFAIPDCPSEQKAKILKICQQTGCTLKTMPALHQLPSSNIGVKVVRDVQIEDLLGRDPIKINIEAIMNYVSNKVVMVTGGGGSIGSELCRQLAAHGPKQLIIFDMYENNAYDIQNELKSTHPELNLVTLIGSVRDSHRIEAVFEKYRPQIVYHAAAHKHVPLMEESPNEAVKNNVIGTLKTVRAADKFGTERFVLISTDKAVNPTSVMGATKRMCEMIVQTYNKRSKTEFVAVRFGNVLGSNGSVIPLFKKQIAEGGPVTVTDKNIIRYFMTIPEAVSLVIQAGATAKGGEIFVLDMGKPVKIVELAENLIRLSGYIPYVDIDIKFTGLRPGEKLYEELLMSEEGLKDTDNSLIFIGKPIEFDEEEFLKDLDYLSKIMYDDNVDIRATIKKIVPTCMFDKQ